MKTTENILSEIADAISINKNGQLSFAGIVIENNFYNSAQSRKKEIVQTISSVAYQKFYSAATLLSKPVFSETEVTAFKNNLFNAYHPAPTLNSGWRIIEKESNGISYFQKQSEVIRLAPGYFLAEYDELKNQFERADYYSVLANIPVNSDQNYFHFVHGTTPNTGTEHPLVRFYFHLQPQGAVPLIKLVTHWFNAFKIGFSFKCCANPNHYIRTDSAVLYLANHYFSSGLQLLEKIIPQIKNHLREQVPLFALPLANGFSFAENPNNTLSFGESRCNIIAEAIFECLSQKLNQSQYVQFITDKIKGAGYNLSAMHLNPGSAYPYCFSLATFT